MCGIAGIFSYRSKEPTWEESELLRIREAMASRGPDGSGLWRSLDGRLGLAHRRLAILDPSSAGLQPMVSPDGRLALVYNGEIYNYRELREELESDGVVFRSNTDTEVLLHLYERAGAEMLQRLRGMFAFALWDASKRRLLLARDPFGIKPLYFADDGRTFRFASQVKALAAGGRLNGQLSPAGVAGFFIWGHVPEPWTWLKAVRSLPAGTWLEVRDEAPLMPAQRYFNIRDEILLADSESQASRFSLEETVEALADSVRHHLVGDVPVGLFLSAGKDSNLISALAVQSGAKDLRAITLGFQEYTGTPADEACLARECASFLGLDHHVALIQKADFMEERERILAAMDQPTIDGVNMYFVSRAAHRAGWKVALSGLGGDELFGGYSSFSQVPRLVSLLRPLSALPFLGPAFRRFGSLCTGHRVNPKWAGLIEYGNTLERAWLLRRALVMPWELPQFLDSALACEGLAELAMFETLRSRIRGIRNAYLAILALELSGYIQNQLLRDADWTGMVHSVEIRVPLLDIVVLRRWLPMARHHFPLNRYRLMQAVQPLLAILLRTRPKSGFSVPVARWIQAPHASAPREVGLRPWARAVAGAFGIPSPGYRIAALVTDAYGSIGGIAKFNQNLLNALAQMQEVRTILALPMLLPPGSGPVPDKVHLDASAARGKLAFLWRTARLVLDPKTLDLVICGHINLLPLAWATSRLRRCPLLLMAYGIEVWNPHPNALVRMLLFRTDAIASISRYTRDRLIAWTGLSEERFRLLPCSVDLNTFTPRPRKAPLAQRYGLQGKRVLLTVARLVGRERYKGHDEIIEILPQLAQEVPEIVYLVVGDGDDLQRLRNKAKTLAVADRVIFTGRVDEDAKVDFYNLADVFVMPGRGEGFGIVYLEAMACGVPTIGSVLDGSVDALDDGRLGQLVDPRDPKQLLTAIRHALSAPRGRPRGLEQFSRVAHEKRVSELIRDLLRQRP